MSEETPEKITVTYDDLNTRKVEHRLKEQEALTRNRVYASMDETMVTPAQAAGPNALQGLWRNSIFALALFGLIGGVLAWGLGTLLELKADIREDSAERIAGIKQLIKLKDDHQKKRAEEIDPDKQNLAEDAEEVRLLRGAIANAIEEGKASNAHFAQLIIPIEAQFRRESLDRYAALEKHEMLTDEDRKQRQRDLETWTRENEDLAVMYNEQLTRAQQEQQLQQLAEARHQRADAIVEHENLRSFISNILAYGVRGIVLGMLLAIAVPLTENNIPATLINGSVGAALGLLGGVAAAFVTSRIQSLVTDPDPNSTQQFLATVATWGALGLFLTLAPGIVMRNRKKLVIGLTGGLIGGLIGGVLFEPISQVKWLEDYPLVPELIAMVSIGLLAGLATGLIEDAAKSGWLKVAQGLIAGKQFILYRSPTYIGASPDCQIYLFKDPKVGKRHAAIHIVPNGFEIEDLPLGTNTLVNGKNVSRARLKNGDRIQVGSTQLVFMEKEQSVA